MPWPQQPGDRPAIEVEGLGRRFGEIEAVRGISFAVARGELFGFLGPNGAGKTTTVRMLTTLLLPTAGRARIDGMDVVAAPREVRKRIGVVFQEASLDHRLVIALVEGEEATEDVGQVAFEVAGHHHPPI